MPRQPRLADALIAARLPELPGWSREGETLRRVFTFPGFPDAVAFIARLVAPAEALDHHPDVDLRYNRVTVTLTTHDSGGITEHDLTLAARISALTLGQSA